MAGPNKVSQTNNNEVYNKVILVLEIIVLQLKFWFALIKEVITSFAAKEPLNVRGETVLITGTGHGMGKETALQYAALGAKVICWDINEKNNSETVQQIKKAKGEAHGYTINVTNRADILELAAKVKKEHGFVSIVVNNAGIMPCHPLLETTEAEIKSMYDINVLAHFWIMHAFLPDMLAKDKGHFVALSSCAGLFPLVNLVPYCGTKFAVRGLMQSIQEELRVTRPGNNIKFTTIYPYIVDTGLCKNPRFRFEHMKPVNPKEAAASIIQAQRAQLVEASIPRHYLYMEKIGRLIPRKAMLVLNDFLDTGVDSDKL